MASWISSLRWALELLHARVPQYRVDVLFLVLHVLKVCDGVERIGSAEDSEVKVPPRDIGGGEEKTSQRQLRGQVRR